MVFMPRKPECSIVHTCRAGHPGSPCYSVTDERSAGGFCYRACLHGGNGLRRKPVVCCTSGTALLNLHPAVAEAYIRKYFSSYFLPIVPAWINQMDWWTLPQPGVFQSLVNSRTCLASAYRRMKIVVVL